MGLFGGKKKKGADVDVALEQNEVLENNPKGKEKKPKAKKSKKNDLLKIFDESVWESVHEDFKANKQFIIEGDNGEPLYIGLFFDTQSVGGFTSKDAKRDESKGSIIEAIRTGRIKTFIRPEMLMDDCFVIIPDEETVDNMDEFVMLTDVDYILCSVNDEGVVNTMTEGGTDDDDDPEIVVQFEQIADIVKNGKNISSLLPYIAGASSKVAEAESAVDFSNEDADDDMFGDNNEIEDLPDDMDEDLDDDSFDDLDDDASSGMSDDLDDISDDEPKASAPDMSVSNADFSGMDDIDDIDSLSPDDLGGDLANDIPDMNPDDTGFTDMQDGDDDGGYDTYENVSGNVVYDYVERNFYSDDLGLKISTEPFDAQFLHGNSYLPFNEERGSGWLNEYLSNIAKDANVRMERMHNENLFKMRERYMRLIQGHCGNIAKTLDVSDMTTQYGKMRYAIEQNKIENLESVDRAVAIKRDQLQAAWNAKLEAVASEAAQRARNQYEADHGRTHDNDLAQLESREKDEIERDYQNSINQLNKDRRDEASKLLDLAINETLKRMSVTYLKVLRSEKKEYIRLQNQMTRFIDDNRKDEKARIDALAEENRQIKKANEVRRDYTSKIKALSAEFDMKRTMLQADIDRINKEHEFELESNRSDWAAKLEEEKSKSGRLQEQVNELLEKFAELDDKKNEEYKSRITELENLNKLKDDDMDRIVEAHKRSNVITVLLVVAILIASIGVGFMFGTVLNVRKTSQIEREGIYRQYTEENVIDEAEPVVE